MNNLKHRAHAFLELSVPGDRWGYVFDWFMVALIFANVIAVILETVPALSEAYGTFFRYFDTVSVIIFTVEYVLRVWSCTADRVRDYGHPIMGRIKFILSPLGIIDLLAILPFYLGFLIDADLRILRVFRLIRLLKLTRYSPALIIIGAVIRNQSKALTAALFLMLTALVLTSSIIFTVEHRVSSAACKWAWPSCYKRMTLIRTPPKSRSPRHEHPSPGPTSRRPSKSNPETDPGLS